MKVVKYIWVTFQREGVHFYPAAATDPNLATGEWDDVRYLAHPHRHIFYFRVKIEIFHDNRDIEFIQFKRQCEKWIDDGMMELSYKSCEMLAMDLYKLISSKWPDRKITISVAEDNENGAELEWQ